MANTNGSPERKDPRINLAFYDDHLDFCRAQARQNHQSITQFVNSLIAQEKAKRASLGLDQRN